MTMNGGRFVDNGVDRSVETNGGLPSAKNHGSICYTTDTRSFWVADQDLNEWAPCDTVAVIYDFATHGGAVGNIELDLTLPSGTIVVDGVINVLTAVTSDGSATLAVKVQSANDILSAAVLGTNGTTGLHAIVPDGTASKMIACSADRTVTVTVGTAALKAGRFVLYLRCLRGVA